MATGTATIDFGATPTDTATILVTGLSGLTVNSPFEAFAQGSDSTGADNGTDAHQQLQSRTNFNCEYVSASSMNINADMFIGFATGTFTVHYATA
jgi:hypothetical protein